MRRRFAAGPNLRLRHGGSGAAGGRPLLAPLLVAAVGIAGLGAVGAAGRPPAALHAVPAASTGWSSWQALGGPLSGAPDAASWGAGRLDVFARGTDGHLHHRGYPLSTGGWSGYDDLGTIASDPGAAAPRSGRVDVFARFADSQVHQRTFTAGVGWSDWRAIAGDVAGAPDAASARDGRLYLVARNGSGEVVLNVGSTTGSWSGWQVIAGRVSSDPSAVARQPGTLNVFARGSGNDLVHVYNSGSSWRSQSLGGILGTGPDAAAWSAGRVDVFAASPGGTLYQKSWDSTGSWGSWHALSGLLTAAPGAVSWGPGRLDVFVRSTASVLYHSGYSSAGGGMPSIPAYAARYLGWGESPPGSNCTPFEPPGTCLPWCTYFATYVWHHVNPALPYLSYSGSLMAWAKANGRWKAGTSRAAPGDIAIYGNSGGTVHTSIVESASGGRITTIDGNYSDKVTRVGPFDPATVRSPGSILGYASPVPVSGASALRATGGTAQWMPPAPTLEQIRSQDGGR